MKLTGERPMEGHTPDSLIALHDAGYREVLARLPAGRVLDVGCGIGVETARFARADRFVVGIDYDPATAAFARADHGGTASGSGPVEFVTMDGGCLGFRGGSFDAVCSSHIIEHFTMPEYHVAEIARACADDGTAFVITPNRPADFENPYHVYLFEAAELASLLHLFFAEVEIVGLESDAVLKADFAARRTRGERILRLDVLRLRRRIPHRAYVWAYERILPVVYRALGTEQSGIGSGIDDSHLFISPTIESTTPVLFATARRPRRFPTR